MTVRDEALQAALLRSTLHELTDAHVIDHLVAILSGEGQVVAYSLDCPIDGPVYSADPWRERLHGTIRVNIYRRGGEFPPPGHWRCSTCGASGTDLGSLEAFLKKNAAKKAG